MIYFFADNHYHAHPGKVIFDHLPETLKSNIFFAEDDWSVLEQGDWVKNCELLILNLIGDTCGIPHPGRGAERSVKEYCERGGNLLLLHGSSAAFWQWDWWRPIVGERWVRPGDPDGFEPSTHPKKPYLVKRAKTRHVLASRLQDMNLPEDEIYTCLEHTCPTVSLLETTIEEGTFVQCCETVSPWGGKIVSFIPGHDAAVTSNPVLISNLTAILHYLQEKS